MTFDPQTIALAVMGVIVSIAVGTIGFLARSSWSDLHKKVDELKKYSGEAIDDLYKTKADDSELTRARDTQKEMFVKFDKHDAEDRERHGQIMLQIGELKGMMNTLLLRKRGSD